MDKIAEMLTIVRNGSQAKLEKVDLPSSKVRESIAKILTTEGFVRSFKIAKDSKQGVMRIYLKYDEQGNPTITNLTKVSTPGRRNYVHASQIPVIRSGTGTCILSTNKCMITCHEAKKHNVGGEFICTVW